MGNFLVMYGSTVVIYNHRAVIRLATDLDRSRFSATLQTFAGSPRLWRWTSPRRLFPRAVAAKNILFTITSSVTSKKSPKMKDFYNCTKICIRVWAFWAKYLLQHALKSWPKCNKLPNLVTLTITYLLPAINVLIELEQWKKLIKPNPFVKGRLHWIKLGREPRSGVMGEDSVARDCDFEIQNRIL